MSIPSQTLRTLRQWLDRPHLVAAADEGVYAARQGRTFGRNTTKETVSSGTTILSTTVLNIPTGRTAFVTQVLIQVNSANDKVLFEIGAATGLNLTGTFAPVLIGVELTTSNQTPFSGIIAQIYPPVALCCHDWKSVGVRVTTTEDSADVSAGYRGWLE